MSASDDDSRIQEQPRLNTRGGYGVRTRGSAFQRIGGLQQQMTRTRETVEQNGGVTSTDLRDKIATKMKANVTDLRDKLASRPPPKAKASNKPRPPIPHTQPSFREPRIPSHYAPTLGRPAAPYGQVHTSPPSRSAPPPPLAQKYRLPSEAEAKKITVTVPGLSKTTSEVRRTTVPLLLAR